MNSEVNVILIGKIESRVTAFMADFQSDLNKKYRLNKKTQPQSTIPSGFPLPLIP